VPLAFADLEVRAPIPRFRVPMHTKKRKRALSP
jgi:hypothetical protein